MSNYPAGAEHDPNAPYNQKDLKELKFDATCSQTLCKNQTIYTNEYETLEGAYYSLNEDSWCQYHYTPLQLINKLKELVTKHPDIVFNAEGLIKECEGWEEIETTIIED